MYDPTIHPVHVKDLDILWKKQCKEMLRQLLQKQWDHCIEISAKYHVMATVKPLTGRQDMLKDNADYEAGLVLKIAEQNNIILL